VAPLNLGISYLTAAELAALQPLLPLTALTEDNKADMCSMASRAIDGYVGRAFGARAYDAERHDWLHASRRVYPLKMPVIEVARLRIYISNTQYVTISPADVFINNADGYLEIASLVLTTSLAPALVSLGLTTPVAEVCYAAGYGAWEDSTGTVDEALDAIETEFDISDDELFSVGDIIRVDDEWVQVATVTSGTPDKLTVVSRGGYGTTAATHDTAAAIYRLVSAIPDDVKAATAMTVAAFVNDQILQGEGLGNLKQATIGSYSITIAGPGGAGSFEVPTLAKMMLDRAYKLIALA